MPELSQAEREKLPAKDFGLPEKARTKDAKKESGNYPMPPQRCRAAPTTSAAPAAITDDRLTARPSPPQLRRLPRGCCRSAARIECLRRAART